MTKKEIIKYVEESANERYNELLTIRELFGEDSLETSRAREKWYIVNDILNAIKY